MLSRFVQSFLAQRDPAAAQDALKASAALGLRWYHKNVSCGVFDCLRVVGSSWFLYRHGA